MKNATKIVLASLMALVVFVAFASANSNSTPFLRTGMVITDGNHADFENPLPVSVGSQKIWKIGGFGEAKDGKKIAKLLSIDFDFSGTGVEVVEEMKFIVLDMDSYKGGQYTFSNK